MTGEREASSTYIFMNVAVLSGETGRRAFEPSSVELAKVE